MFVVVLPADHKICEGNIYGDKHVLKCIGGTAGFTNGAVDSALFKKPSFIAFSNDGNYLLVTDEENHCVRKITRPPGSDKNILEDSYSQVETVAGVCGSLSVSHMNKFKVPKGISIHRQGYTSCHIW